MSTELPNLTLPGPEEEQADSPACHAGDSGGSTRRDRQIMGLYINWEMASLARKRFGVRIPVGPPYKSSYLRFL